MQIKLAIGWGVACWMMACSASSNPPNAGEPTRLTDSTGETFAFVCSPSKCTLTASAGLPPDCDRWTLFFSGRVMSLCASLRGGTVDGLCRPLVCAADSDCPVFQTGRGTYTCSAGICQNLTSLVDADDVVGLCLAASPRGGGCGDLFASAIADPAATAASSAALVACGSQACAVPPQCQQL